MVKNIEVPETFYNDYLQTNLTDTFYAIILLQNIFYYHLDETELAKVNKVAEEELGLESGKQTNLTKIFPQYIGEYIFKYTSQPKNVNLVSFLREIGIKLLPAKIETTFF